MPAKKKPRPLKDTSAGKGALPPNEHFERLFHAIPLAAVLSRLEDGMIFDVNQRWESLLGFSKEEAAGKTPIELGLFASEEERNRLIEPLHHPSRTGKAETQARTRSGGLLDVIISAEVLDIASQACILAIFEDITEEKLIAREHARLASFPEWSPNPIIELRLDGQVTYANPKALDLFPSLIAQSLEHPFLAGAAEEILEAQKRGDAKFTRSIRVHHIWYEQLFYFVNEGQAVRLYAIDITARKLAEERLRFEATHDALTHLPNRLLLLNRLDHAIERLQRSNTAPIAVLFLDFDDFKIANDSLGHAFGDQILIEAARRLQRCIRPGDTVARMGGDEFAILLESVEKLDDLERAAQRVLDILRRPYTLAGREYDISVSIGIAHVRAPAHSSESILHHADLAMYSAKRQGKNRFALYVPPTPSVQGVPVTGAKESPGHS